jgi:hypothetical protein
MKTIPYQSLKGFNKTRFKKSGFVLLLFLSGCASTSEDLHKGSGSDKLPQSVCASCTKEPFYKAGKWLTDSSDRLV